MTPTAGAPHLCSLAAAVALFLPIEAIAETTTAERLQVLKSNLLRYDPAIREAAEADHARRDADRQADAWRRAEQAPPSSAAPAPAAKPPAPGEKILELPKITVRSDVEPIKRLPRIDTPATPPPDQHPDAYELPAAREARLVKKHLTPFQRRLISLFGGSPAAEARAAEARALKAAQMNDLANSLEIQEAAGRDPADIKKLRAEYLKLYYSGPKQ